MEVLSERESNDKDSEDTFHDVDCLQNYGINVADIKKLKAAGICTIKGIQMTIKRRLCSIKGLSEAKVDKIKEACSKISAIQFYTALQISGKRKQVFRISTGSKDLDKLIGGGIESMAITEAFGEFRTGKTQMSHTLCVTVQIPNETGYTGGKAIFIDTEHTLYAFVHFEKNFSCDDICVLIFFLGNLGDLEVIKHQVDSRQNIRTLKTEAAKVRPDRLRLIADRFDLDQEEVLENVLYARAYTSEHQQELLDYVAAKFYEEAGMYKLLVIDSVMALFRVDYSGRGELADRQQKLAQMMSRLQKISEEYNVAVFITNQMTSDPGAALSFQADPKKPIGGNILAHASTTRLSLRKGRGETRIAKIYDSPDMPESEATFAITSGGIDDAKD